MVLGLIDFLLGGKKKTKVPKTGQVTTPIKSVNSTPMQDGPVNLPDGQSKPTENVNSVDDVKFEDSNKNKNGEVQQTQKQAPVSNSVQSQTNKKSISVVINKIHEELKGTNERVTELVTNVKNIENSVNSLSHRIEDLEESKKTSDEKIGDIDSNMGKFLSLYELINNQYNPFVETGGNVPVQKVMIKSDGNSESIGSSDTVDAEENSVSNESKSFDDLNLKQNSVLGNQVKFESPDLKESLLELDTLSIEEAAGDAVPLTFLKNNTNSLVIILSWLEYMIKKVGIDETRNTLRYYTEVLRWITPEVYFDLDKYLRGMKDKKDLQEGETLTVEDHIVSLYFISKLNEKTLDEKLTKAVLQIIKQ